jgi:ribonucleoside-triphosphate reductase
MFIDVNTRSLMAETKFYDGYSRLNEKTGRYETWDEAVDRVMKMHRDFFRSRGVYGEELEELIKYAEDAYREKLILGAQRALQFGGEQLLKHQMRLYNCTSSYCDRAAFFGELMYILLCGAGAGFSVQFHHIEKLPKIVKRKKSAKIFVIQDSIEGWAEAIDVLLSSFFVGGGKHPEYAGHRIWFDKSKIRERGAIISGGFKAPGPEPLMTCLAKIEDLLIARAEIGDALRPIDAYDIAMYIADAVIAGGVRRSATICLFSKDDMEMAAAKTGNWFEENPQRGRSNNSAVLVRGEVSAEEFAAIFENTRQFGEPGFIWTNDRDITFNPCVEIGKYPVWIEPETGTKISGWQGCNLVETNGAKCVSKEAFLRACKAGAILATLQAAYTDFKFIDPVSKLIFDREALIGVSITGWMNSPDVLLNAELQREGAETVKAWNKIVAKMININPAARTTCVKPSGNASVLLGTESAAGAAHAPRFLRTMQMTKNSPVAQLIRATNPYMVEESVWSTHKTDYAVMFPVIAPEGSHFKKDYTGVKFLEIIKLIQNNWVEYGTDLDLCVNKEVRHNVSNTVTVQAHEWDEVRDYIYENRDSFCGISLLAGSGDKDYNQAPFTEVKTAEQIAAEYGPASMLASGLIVDCFEGFSNLWDAITTAKYGDTGDREKVDVRKDWLRRFQNFADNYLDGDTQKTEYCLKDVYLLHKWAKIQKNFKPIDFTAVTWSGDGVDIDTMAAQACAGGGCEL